MAQQGVELVGFGGIIGVNVDTDDATANDAHG
jgi:hypothetical protein